MKIITFDLEIKKGFDEVPKGDFSAMGISLGAAYLHWADQYKIYSEDNLEDFKNDFEEAELITGFNITGFDIPLIKAVGKRVGVEFDFPNEKIYDIFADVKFSLNNHFPKGWKLDNIAQATLPFGKNGDGAEAPKLWQTGQIAKLATYVLQDVKVEKTLFEFVLQNGFVRNSHTTPEVLNLRQIALIKEKMSLKAC
jgi:hypothetical protein